MKRNKNKDTIYRTVLIFLILAMLQPLSAGSNGTYIPPSSIPYVPTPTATNSSNLVHSNHVWPGSAGLQCDTCHGFPPAYNNLYQMCVKCHPATPTPTATAIPVSTYIPPPAPTATAIQVIGMATPVSTVPKVTPLQEQAPKLPVFLRIDKQAHLNVKYDLGKGRTDGEVLVSVSLNNTGNATATNVILSIEHPAGIAITSVSGSDLNGNTITWSGDIIPGSGHVTRYYARGVNTNLASIEIPLRVEYEKTSPAEKAIALAPYAASAPQAYAQAITERDLEIINLTMRLALVLIPGFEGILAIFALIGALGMKKRNRGG